MGEATLSILEESGLVERSSDPNDGRQVIFRLTAEGRRVRVEASARKRRWLTVALQNLTVHEQRTMLPYEDNKAFRRVLAAH
jgi:DNA-binding MarR family transcriptional regulator